MGNTIRIKRSGVQGKIPLVSDLQLGELAVNHYDGKLYTRKNDGTDSIVELTGGGGGAGATYTVSSTAPSSPSAGDRWLDSDIGVEFTWVNDGDSSAWVQTGVPGAGQPGATGPAGADGPAGTIAVGTVTTGAAGSSATVTNAGTSSAAVFDFTIPRGDTGSPGNDGAPGAAATVSVGTVTTGAAGSSATVTNSGTSSAAVLDFTIPRGDTGATGETAQVASMTATQQSTSTALANVTELALAMEANATYEVDCFVTFQSAATTTGLNLGFTTPTGCRPMVEVVIPITSTGASSQLRTIFPTAATTTSGNVLSTGVSAINSNHTARISGTVKNGATAGNFQVQFATEATASAITLQIGSTLVLTRIA